MNKSIFSEIKLVEINKLREHEEIDIKYFKQLMKEIRSDGILKQPIVADEKTMVVIDGEHRLRILKKLGCKKIPVIFVNYQSPKIKIFPWRKEEKVSKKSVIRAGLSKDKLPPKTSKHMIKVGNGLKHVSFLQRRVDIPLKKLKNNSVFKVEDLKVN